MYFISKNYDLNKSVDQFRKDLSTEKKRSPAQIKKDAELMKKIEDIVNNNKAKLKHGTIERAYGKLDSLLELDERIHRTENRNVMTKPEKEFVERIRDNLNPYSKIDRGTKPKPSPAPDIEDAGVLSSQEEDLPPIEPLIFNDEELLEEKQDQVNVEAKEEQIGAPIQQEKEHPPEHVESQVRAQTPAREEQPQEPAAGPPAPLAGNIPPPPPGPPPPLGKKLVVVQKRFQGEPDPLPDDWATQLKDPNNPEMKTTLKNYLRELEATINPINELLIKHATLIENIKNLNQSINSEKAKLNRINNVIKEIKNVKDKTTIIRKPTEKDPDKHYRIIPDTKFEQLNQIQKQNKKDPLPEKLKKSNMLNIEKDRRDALVKTIDNKQKKLEQVQDQLVELEKKTSGEVPFKDFNTVYAQKKEIIRKGDVALRNLDKPATSKLQQVKQVANEQEANIDPDLQWFNSLPPTEIIKLQGEEEAWLDDLDVDKR